MSPKQGQRLLVSDRVCPFLLTRSAVAAPQQLYAVVAPQRYQIKVRPQGQLPLLEASVKDGELGLAVQAHLLPVRKQYPLVTIFAQDKASPQQALPLLGGKAHFANRCFRFSGDN